MRDIKRIPKTLKLIEKIWKANPDLRLTQLIGNCFNSGDLYYINDDKLLSGLKYTYDIDDKKDTVKK